MLASALCSLSCPARSSGFDLNQAPSTDATLFSKVPLSVCFIVPGVVQSRTAVYASGKKVEAKTYVVALGGPIKVRIYV